MENASFLPARVTSYWLVAFVFVNAALLSIVATLWIERQHTAELSALPDRERQLVYEHTLATLRFTCGQAASAELDGYCDKQAHFLSLMQECGASCQAECQKHLPKATR